MRFRRTRTMTLKQYDQHEKVRVEQLRERVRGLRQTGEPAPITGPPGREDTHAEG